MARIVQLEKAPEASRILIAMARACGELIGADDAPPPAEAAIRKMVRWYGAYAAPGVERAIANRRNGGGGDPLA